jgi:hypothetical protein
MPAQRRPGDVFDDDRRRPTAMMSRCTDPARGGVGCVPIYRRGTGRDDLFDIVGPSADRMICSDVPALRRPVMVPMYGRCAR